MYRNTKEKAQLITYTIKTILKKLRENALYNYKENKLSSDWNYYKLLRNFTSQAIIREKGLLPNYFVANENQFEGNLRH